VIEVPPLDPKLLEAVVDQVLRERPGLDRDKVRLAAELVWRNDWILARGRRTEKAFCCGKPASGRWVQFPPPDHKEGK